MKLVIDQKPKFLYQISEPPLKGILGAPYAQLLPLSHTRQVDNILASQTSFLIIYLRIGVGLLSRELPFLCHKLSFPPTVASLKLLPPSDSAVLENVYSDLEAAGPPFA